MAVKRKTARSLGRGRRPASRRLIRNERHKQKLRAEGHAKFFADCERRKRLLSEKSLLRIRWDTGKKIKNRVGYVVGLMGSDVLLAPLDYLRSPYRIASASVQEVRLIRPSDLEEIGLGVVAEIVSGGRPKYPNAGEFVDPLKGIVPEAPPKKAPSKRQTYGKGWPTG